MISREGIDEMKRLHKSGLSVRKIAETLGYSATTVQRYVTCDDGGSDVSFEIRKQSILDAHITEIEMMVNANRRWGKQSVNLKLAHRILLERHAGLSVSYRAFCRFANNRCRFEGGRELSSIPLNHGAGEAQIDFFDVIYFKDGRRINGNAFTMSFPYSNARFVQIFPAQNQQCLFFALVRSFAAIGGVPRSILFDNASTAVKKVERGCKREINERFHAFAAHYGFEPLFCNAASGNEKGNVEAANKYVRKNYLSPPPALSNEITFNEALLKRCFSDLNAEHYRKRVSVASLFEEDKAALYPLPPVEFDITKSLRRHADKCALVNVLGSIYSVSDRHKCAVVIVKLGAFSVEIFDKTGTPICRHERSYTRGERSILMESYVDALAKRPRAALSLGVLDGASQEVRAAFAKARSCDRRELLRDHFESDAGGDDGELENNDEQQHTALQIVPYRVKVSDYDFDKGGEKDE